MEDESMKTCQLVWKIKDRFSFLETKKNQYFLKLTTAWIIIQIHFLSKIPDVFLPGLD